MKNSITLTGTITSDNFIDGVVELSIDVGQEFPVHLRFRLKDKNSSLIDEGKALIGRISRATGVMNPSSTSEFVGHEITVQVVQPAVCTGLIQPLVVVDVGVPR